MSQVKEGKISKLFTLLNLFIENSKNEKNETTPINGDDWTNKA